MAKRRVGTPFVPTHPNYFRGNAERMNYADFLAASYPIASGVIERAYRTVVKDRMERAGMRWVFDGAHAMMG